MKVTLNQMSEIFGVTYNTVKGWIEKKDMPAHKDGRNWVIDTTEAIQWYVDYKTPTVTETELDGEYWDVQYRKAKAQLMENKSLKERGFLVTVQEADELMIQRLQQVAEQLKNIPLNWAPYLVGLEHTAESQEKLQTLLNQMFDVLSSLPEPELPESEDGEDVDDVDISDERDIEDE